MRLSSVFGRKRVALLAAVLTLGSSLTAFAYGIWYPVGGDTIPFVAPYSQRQADWTKWAYTQPAATNPVLDATGENCAQGQSGSTWFLAGSFDSAPVTRSCTIPAGKVVVIPVINEAWLAFPEDDNTPSVVRANNVCTAGATNLKLTIDGIPVGLSKLLNLRESKLTNFVLPAGNIFGPDYDGQVISTAADKGYYYAVSLLKGTHKLSWSATSGCAWGSQNITYNITVQ